MDLGLAQIPVLASKRDSRWQRQPNGANDAGHNDDRADDAEFAHGLASGLGRSQEPEQTDHSSGE
jgi:hypothetical protein